MNDCKLLIRTYVCTPETTQKVSSCIKNARNSSLFANATVHDQTVFITRCFLISLEQIDLHFETTVRFAVKVFLAEVVLISKKGK